MKGIDLSHHNGTVNFDAVKAAGLQFCIIELGMISKVYKNAKQQATADFLRKRGIS
jgi:GH25 family lysozyme M1 (1,4-beta-N-acetylmuramidase)